MSDPAFDFRHLSVTDRLQLVEDIWDSIAVETPDAIPLTDAQRTELDRRLAAHEREPSSAVPWDQVRAELFGQTERGG